MSSWNTPSFMRKLANPLFAITVIVPSLAAAGYYGFLASDIYVSESRFVVRMPEKSSSSALGVFLKSTGFSTSADDSLTAQSAVLSRDALRALNRKSAFHDAMTRPDVSVFDRFAPLGMHDSFEELFLRFKKQVTIERDTAGNISVLRVKAYTPQDAQHFNEQLLEIAEGTVNRLNERGRNDLIQFASKEVDEAKSKAQTAAIALAAFRQRTQIVDPEKQAAIQLQMIAKLQDELIATRSQIRGLEEVAPRNSQIAVLRAKVRELRQEIRSESANVAGADKSLATASVEYQRVELDNQVAAKQLAGALASLEAARNEAHRKQAYVERIAQPNLPDASLEPRRWRGFFSVIVVGLIIYLASSMLLAGLREHRD